MWLPSLCRRMLDPENLEGTRAIRLDEFQSLIQNLASCCSAEAFAWACLLCWQRSEFLLKTDEADGLRICLSLSGVRRGWQAGEANRRVCPTFGTSVFNLPLNADTDRFRGMAKYFKYYLQLCLAPKTQHRKYSAMFQENLTIRETLDRARDRLPSFACLYGHERPLDLRFSHNDPKPKATSDPDLGLIFMLMEVLGDSDLDLPKSFQALCPYQIQDLIQLFVNADPHAAEIWQRNRFHHTYRSSDDDYHSDQPTSLLSAFRPSPQFFRQASKYPWNALRHNPSIYPYGMAYVDMNTQTQRLTVHSHERSEKPIVLYLYWALEQLCERLRQRDATTPVPAVPGRPLCRRHTPWCARPFYFSVSNVFQYLHHGSVEAVLHQCVWQVSVEDRRYWVRPYLNPVYAPQPMDGPPTFEFQAPCLSFFPRLEKVYDELESYLIPPLVESVIDCLFPFLDVPFEILFHRGRHAHFCHSPD